jgi:hypothetical protein
MNHRINLGIIHHADENMTIKVVDIAQDEKNLGHRARLLREDLIRQDHWHSFHHLFADLFLVHCFLRISIRKSKQIVHYT